MEELLWVLAASLLAGMVDAVVGGGGLILTPALFATWPQALPALLLGTNKSASIWGTTFAAWQYGRRVTIQWRMLTPALACAFGAAFLGAWTVTLIDARLLRQTLPVLLIVIFLYTLAKKDLGRYHCPQGSRARQTRITVLMALGLGWYDGFFGPGTGSFLVFMLVRFLGFDFLHASAHAKPLNVATNLAAIALFASKGYVWWHVGLLLAVGNVAGSLVGTHLAGKHGAGFVRGVFLFVVSALIVKTGWEAVRLSMP